MKARKKILILMGHYLPGYKDGGPVRSVKNMTDYLGDEYDFHVLAYDRDHGDTEPYANIKINEWNQVGKTRVFYVPPGGYSMGVIEKLASQADIIYVWGCFDIYAIKTLLLNRSGRIKKPVVVVGMGLFSPMGFRIHYLKKKVFMVLMNLMGVFKNIYWSASSPMEVSEIQKQARTNAENYFIAPDIPQPVNTAPIHKQKASGELKIVWISRIARKKNLMAAIQIIERVKGHVTFTVYGPIYDEAYWAECLAALNRLPDNIQWEYKGIIDSEQVVDSLKTHHVFLFPTFGENYGHVIQEALSAGCPCILSDQTPWQDLESRGAGYVYPLEQVEKYISAIDRYAMMDEDQFGTVAENAHQYAIWSYNERLRDSGYKHIFDTL